MKYISLIAVTVVLAGCSSIEERQANSLELLRKAEETASGAVNNAMQDLEGMLQKGKTVTDGVGEMVDDAKRRIDQVQSGVDLMLDGKEMIQGGIKGDE